MSWYEEYLAQMQLPPEWSVSKQDWQPYDSGWYEANQDYQRQAMQMLLDPTALLSGGFGPMALQDTVEVVPGVRDGETYIGNIMGSMAPDSPEYMIAEFVAAGGSPLQAVEALKQQGIITVPNGPDGKPDTRQYDHYMSFANDLFSKRMSDTPDTQKVTPNPAVQAFIDAGFTDPRQQFNADYVDPNLAGARDALAVSEQRNADLSARGRRAEQPGTADYMRNVTGNIFNEPTVNRDRMSKLWDQRLGLKADEGRATNVANLYESLYGTPFQMEAMQRSGMPMPQVPQGLFYETPSGPPPMRRVPQPNVMGREASGYGNERPLGPRRIQAPVVPPAAVAAPPQAPGPFQYQQPQSEAAQRAAFEQLFLRRPQQADRRNMR